MHETKKEDDEFEVTFKPKIKYNLKPNIVFNNSPKFIKNKENKEFIFRYKKASFVSSDYTCKKSERNEKSL